MSEVQRTPRPDEWLMFDGSKKIAVLRLLEIGPKKERVIRSVTWAEKSEDRLLIGYFPHLRMAAWLTWREWMKANGKEPPPL